MSHTLEIHDALTGEIIRKELTAAEISAAETEKAQADADKAQADADKAAARQTVLDKINLTADELTALLA